MKNYEHMENSFFLPFFLFIYPPPIQDLHPPPRDLQPKCPWVRCQQVEQQSGDRNTTDTEGLVSLNMQSAKCQGHRRRQHRTEHRHTPNLRTEIEIPDPAGNRTRAAGLEGGEFTDHASATDMKNSTGNYFPVKSTALSYKLIL